MIQEPRPFLYFCHLHNMVSRIALFAGIIWKKKKDEGYPKRVNGPGLRTLHVAFSHIPLTRTQLQGCNIQAVLGNTTELWAWERIGIGLYSYLLYSTVIFISIFKKLIPLLDLAVIYWFSILLLIVIALSFVIFFLILNFYFLFIFQFLEKDI